MQIPQTQVGGKKGLAIEMANKNVGSFQAEENFKDLNRFCQSMSEL